MIQNSFGGRIWRIVSSSSRTKPFQPGSFFRQIEGPDNPTSQLHPIIRKSGWSGTEKEERTKEMVEDDHFKSCMWRVVCDKVVCERVVCERLWVKGLCVKDCLWQSCVCVKDYVWQSCLWQSCVWKIVCVTKLCVKDCVWQSCVWKVACGKVA